MMTQGSIWKTPSETDTVTITYSAALEGSFETFDERAFIKDEKVKFSIGKRHCHL